MLNHQTQFKIFAATSILIFFSVAHLYGLTGLAASIWSDTFWTVFSLGTGILCLRAAQHGDPRFATAWRFFAGANLSWFIGMLIWSWNELVEGQNVPFPATSDFFFMLFAPVFGFGLWKFQSTEGRIDTGYWRRVFDLGLIASASFVIVLLMFYEHFIEQAEITLYFLAAISYPAIYLTVAVFGISRGWLFVWGRNQWIFGFLLSGFLLHAIIDTIYAHTLLGRVYQVGNYIDVIWLIGFALISVAAVDAVVEAKREIAPADTSQNIARGAYDPAILLITSAPMLGTFLWFSGDIDPGAMRLVIPGIVTFLIFAVAREIRGRQMEYKLLLEARAAIARHTESEKRLRDVAETSYDRLWETDEDLRFTSVTDRRGVNLVPIPDTAIGLTRWELIGIDPEKNEPWRKHCEDLLARREFRDFEYLVPAENDESQYWSVSGKPYFDGDGNFSGYRGSSSNITTRKYSEEKSAWLINAIDHISETVAIYDYEDRLVFSNRMFRERNQAVTESIKPGVKYEVYLREAVANGLIKVLNGKEEEWITWRLKQHLDCAESFEVIRIDSHLLTNEQRLPDGGIASIAIDITAQKQAEEKAKDSRARVEDILAIAPEAIITIGSDMRIQMFNKGAERIFGYSLDEVIGQPMEILMPEHLRHHHHRHIEDFDKSPVDYRFMDQREDISGQRKDGTVFPATASVSKLRIAGEKVFTVMLHDITERRKSEAERRTALREAEQANRAKTEFLATMSHELRTPLNAIIGFSDMLIGQVFGKLGSEKYDEYALDIQSSGAHLLALVNDILDLSAIESGEKTLTKEKLFIQDVITDCTHMVTGQASQRNIEFTLQAPDVSPPLHADRRAVTQILINLLSNAIKFTQEGGKVELTVNATNEQHVIEVRDTGRGIPANDIDSLTKPFVRGKINAHNTQEGSGLGLAIVKSFVDLHDGQLFIESEVGKGTVIHVVLPNGDA